MKIQKKRLEDLMVEVQGEPGQLDDGLAQGIDIIDVQPAGPQE